jgi:hypothetical protein
MGYKAYYQQGDDIFDISSGPFWLTEDFIPPVASEEPVFAGGAGSNPRGGSALVDLNTPNQAFDYSLNIDGDSGGEIKANLRALNDFLLRAGNEGKPLYLCFKPDNLVGAEPIFGQWNASVRLEVIFARAWPSSKFMVGSLRERLLPDCKVEQVVKPYTLGSDAISGKALGLVYPAVFPKDDHGMSRGVRVVPALTNLITNGSAETNTTGWSKSAALETFERSTREHLYGRASFRMAETSSAGSGEGAQLSSAIAVTHDIDYVLLASIKKTIYPSSGVSAIRILWYTPVMFLSQPLINSWTQARMIGSDII